MCASALPGESGTHEMHAKMNQKRQNNIHDIIDCNSTKKQILIVFGTGIPDTTGHQMTTRVST